MTRDLTGDLTGRLGADVSIEAVGLPATFELAVKLVRPGGRIANIGVHGGAVTLRLDEQWIRDITITTGLKDTSSTPTLMRLRPACWPPRRLAHGAPVAWK